MKRIVLIAFVAAVAVIGAVWVAKNHPSAPAATASAGRKILYYQSAMHPWIKSDKPGKCPICGMNLVPVYEGEGGISMAGVVTLKSNSVTVLNVQAAPVQRRRIVRTLRVAGGITSNTRQASWFEFTAYERDLTWLKVGQTFNVTVPSAPGKIYKAQIELHGIRSYADVNLDASSGSTTVRAEILNPPVEAGDLGAQRLFNGLYAEAGVAAETEEVLAVPRSAVLQPGSQPVVYANVGGGNYQQRKIQTGRVGDDFVEVLDGLNEKEMVVTSGNLLIDAETQISQGGN